jgi:osmotically inducible protein OsmC
MTVESSASATWEGSLVSGKGTVRPASGAFPASAHASCLSMALAHGLAGAGHPPERLDTTAKVTFGVAEGISAIHLTVKGKVPGIDAEVFRAAVEDAKANCPVSKALAAVPITAEATLEL